MRLTGAASILQFVLQLTFLRIVQSPDASLVVRISSGSVRGFRVSSPETDVFLGIPFATPPIGRLRFRKPQPVVPWSNILNATRFADACYQAANRTEYPGNVMFNPRTPVSENCLYLNVWVPVPRLTDVPVMVWLYGGSFTVGSTSMDMYDGRYLAAEQGVIVVTLAYRIGIFGFFYLGDESAPGNQGLFDQVMGLRWVGQNIEKFGGDPKRVTLFGNGAGATSISLHLMSPLSSDLFQRAIIQGGVMGSPKVGYQTETPAEAKRRALLYAFEYLECPRNDSPANIIGCMMDMSADDLINDQFFPYSSLIFRPCLDGTFLTRSTDEALNKGHFKKCPLIVGTVKNEGSWFVYHLSPEYLNLTQRTMDRDQFVVTMRRIFTHYPNYPILTNEAYRDKVIALYTSEDNPDDTDTNLASLSAAYGDAYFYCPINEYAGAYSRHGLDVYAFQMTQRFEKNPWPRWMGVVHGDEVYFVFGAVPAPGMELTAEERLLSRAMMTYWGNFARTGNPNMPGSVETMGVWPKYQEESEWLYLDINLQYFSHDGKSRNGNSKKGFRMTECATLIPILIKMGHVAQISNTASQTMVSLAAIVSRSLFSSLLAQPTTCD